MHQQRADELVLCNLASEARVRTVALAFPDPVYGSALLAQDRSGWHCGFLHVLGHVPGTLLGTCPLELSIVLC